MDEMRVRAIYYATEEMLTEIPADEIMKHAKRSLALELSHAILQHKDVFKKQQVKEGLQFRAECYVLTPESFTELVKSIQQSMLSYGPTVPMMGGVNQGEDNI